MKAITYLLIVFSTLCTLGAQLLLKKVISSVASKTALTHGSAAFIESVVLQPVTWVALVLQGSGYIVWLFVLTREKLAVSFALSGSAFYLLTALSAWYLFSERLNSGQWFGISLISTGVLLLAYHGR